MNGHLEFIRRNRINNNLVMRNNKGILNAFQIKIVNIIKKILKIYCNHF